MKPTNEDLKDLLVNLWHLTLAGAATVVIFLCVAMANQSVFNDAFSEQQSRSLYQESEFVLRVSESGETVYESVEGVSEELREELLSTVYPSPEAAEAAATEAVALPWWWPYLQLSKPAYAHAVNVCTTSKKGKVSHQTGGGRHITKHRYDTGGYRYTRTDHQALTINGYQTYDVFKYRIDLDFC